MAIDLTPITSGYSTGKINDNFQKLEDEINNNLLRRDGLGVGEGNEMENPLDMNSYDILNVNNIDVQGFSIQGQSIDGFVQRAEDAALSAEQDASSAATSESNAANSASYAEQQAERAEAAADTSDALVLREDLEDSSNPAKGPALVGFSQDLPGSLPSNVYLKLRNYTQSSDVASGASSDDKPSLQSAINSIAQSAGRSGQREFVINRRHNIGSQLIIPSNIRIVFEEGAALVPNADGVRGMDGIGTLPSTTYPLTADALRGEDRITVGANTAAFSVGQYVWIGDTQIILTSPNMNNITQGQSAKVMAIESGQLILDRVTEYAYSSSTATVGVLNALENISIEGMQFGEEGGFLTGMGMDFRYVMGLKINGARIGYSRSAASFDETYQIQNRNSVNLRGCTDVGISELSGDRIAWYLLSIDGACHNVRVRDARCSFARHGISTNWNGPGEAIDVLIEKVITDSTTYGGIDTHDVGRDITFRTARCRRTKFDGAQIRTSDVTMEDVTFESCGTNGLVIRHEPGTDAKKLTGLRVDKATMLNNGSRGIYSSVPFDGSNIRVKNNGAVYSVSDVCGIMTSGGRLTNIEATDNNGSAIQYVGFGVQADAVKPLLVDGIYAPQSARQQVFMYSSTSYEGREVRVRDADAPGYTAANLFARSGSAYVADIDDRGCKWGTNQRRGRVTLSSGSAVIANDNVRLIGTDAARNWGSRIELRRVTQGSAPGELSVSLSSGVGFTITSSNAADDGVIEWTIV